MYSDAAWHDFRQHAWPQSVELVHADAHRGLASWTVADPHSQASGSMSERAASAACSTSWKGLSHVLMGV